MSENFPRTKKFPKSKKCSKVFCLNKICVARSYHPSVEKLPNIRPIPLLHVGLVTHETDSSSPDSRCCAESDQSSESNAQQFCCFEFFVPSFGCLQSGKGHFLWRAINLARSCTSTYNLHLYSLQLNSHDDQQNGSPKYGFYKSLYRLDLLGSVSFESLPQ